MCAQCSECQSEEIQESVGKWRDLQWLLRIPTSVSAAADRPASYGNQTISSMLPSCRIQISQVGVINTAANHQMFMILTGKLSWQRLRQISRWLLLKNEKPLFEPPFRRLRGNIHTPSMAQWKAHGWLYIRQYTHLTDRQTERIAIAIPCIALHAVAR